MKHWKYSFNMCAYAWASRYCGKANVMDLGCGIGCGMIVVSMVAKSIIGVDREKDQGGRPSLIQARKNIYFCPIQFVIRDLETERVGLDCDVCIAFEVLEHLKNPEFVLEEMSKRCKLFIFSIPREYGTTLGHKQIFHNLEDVKKLVSPFFKKIEWFWFRNGYVSMKPFDNTQRFIGVCSNK